MDPVKAKQHKSDPLYVKYTAKDSIIYALSIGATPEFDLHFLYENHENFQVFPTYAVVNNFIQYLSSWPGLAIDWTKILHGEQYIEMFEPLPAGDGELRIEPKVVDVLDKDSGALIIIDLIVYDNKTGKKHFMMQYGIFYVGYGNFGGQKTTPHEIKGVHVPADKQPEKTLEATIRKDQAAFYRQAGGDLNPLHIDPQFAKTVGFKQPIFHGLGSLGVVSKKILEAYGANDAANFKAVKARFSAPVFPGDKLVIETWQNDHRIHFQTKIKETGRIVINSAYLDLYKVESTPKSSEVPTTKINLKSTEIFKKIGDELTANKNLVSKIDAIILYDITANGKHATSFTLDLKNEPFSVYEGKPKNDAKASVTLTVDDTDFVQLANGKLDGIKAFMSGRLKIRGNIMLMQRLQQIFAKSYNTSKL